MPTGIQVVNNVGTVQVDENYRNLFSRANGTGGNPAATGAMTSPLCALQCSALGFAQGITSGTNITYYVSGGGTYKWWVWDVIVASGGNYGFQIRNAANQLVFDALQKPMRIVDFKQFTAESQWDGVSFTYPSGRQYAVIIGTQPSWFQRTREGSSSEPPHNIIREVWKRGAAKVVGNVITLGWVTTRDEEFLDENPYQITTVRPEMQIIVVDVTNY